MKNSSLTMHSEASGRSVPLVLAWQRPLAARLDRHPGAVFILPAVLVILAFSIFPLLASLYVSLTRLSFAEGGIELKFVGLDNYLKLLVGIDRTHFLGVTRGLTVASAIVLAVIYAGLGYLLVRYIRRPGRTAVGLVGRLLVAVVAGAGGCSPARS
jgi:multiple sugar transport system permease protein